MNPSANTGRLIFTAAEVLRIRAEWDAGAINVRAWAEAKSCAPETVRKIGRRDTYGQVTSASQNLSKQQPPGATQRAELAGLAEPSEAEVAASMARLAAALQPTEAAKVDQMLQDMTQKGGA